MTPTGARRGKAGFRGRRGAGAVARAVYRGDAHRGRSDGPDVGVCRCARADGGDGLCGGPAQDEAEGGVRRQDRSVRCATIGGCVAAGERREHLHSAAGDSRAARSVSGPASGGAVAHAAGADDSRVAAAQRGRRRRRCDAVYQRAGLAWLARCSCRPTRAHAAAPRAAAVARSTRTAPGRRCGGAATGARRDPIAGALDALVGIGPVLALDDPRGDRRHRAVSRGGPELASYAGLVPRVDAQRRSGRITAASRRTGRPGCAGRLVEAAHARHQTAGRLGRWARQLARAERRR